MKYLRGNQETSGPHGSLTVKIAGTNALLLPDRAMYLMDHRALIVSDVHLGKITHFRKHGIGIPQKALYDNFKRLALLIDSINPEKIIFLGDLFHSSINYEWSIFGKFLSSYPDTYFELILGNHDILDQQNYNQLNLYVKRQCIIDQLLLSHEPIDTVPDGLYNIYGHIHPAVRLRGRGRQTLRLPCYLLAKNYAIMPAFGTFTGMHTLSPSSDDLIYAIADGQVIFIS